MEEEIWPCFEVKEKGWGVVEAVFGRGSSHPSLDGSKSLRSRVVPARSKYTNKDRLDYMRDAISFYNEREGTKYELVEPGNTKTSILSRRRLHHIDFKAKKTDVTDAPVEMFFAELITDDNGRSVECCRCMGPKKSISGDKNNGCCYCMDYNVQHPRGGGFMAGGKKLFRSLDEITMEEKAKGEGWGEEEALFEAKGKGRGDGSSDPSLDGSKSLRKKAKFTNKARGGHVRPYAMDAISEYNKEPGYTKYELVEPGNLTTVALPTSHLLHHIDFTAKKTDVADAPVEMFFAELMTVNKARSVERCRSMGPKISISGDKNNGCCYCVDYNVQHPRSGGFLAGREGLFTGE